MYLLLSRDRVYQMIYLPTPCPLRKVPYCRFLRTLEEISYDTSQLETFSGHNSTTFSKFPRIMRRLIMMRSCRRYSDICERACSCHPVLWHQMPSQQDWKKDHLVLDWCAPLQMRSRYVVRNADGYRCSFTEPEPRVNIYCECVTLLRAQLIELSPR